MKIVFLVCPPSLLQAATLLRKGALRYS